jgi:hypothetical protein
MVTSSPIKPSSLKMLRHKKQQQQPVEDATTNDVEITPTYDEETGSENMQTTILTPSVASVNASSTTTGGGGGGRKSRLGLFRKSSSAASSNSGGGGASGENNGQGNDSNNSSDGSGDSNNNNNGKGKDNNDDENKTENDEEDNDKKTKRTPQSSSSSSNNSNNNNPLCPSSTTIFNKERIEFAQKSTLSIHTGSESTAPTTHPSWTPVDGTEFKVRTGPNYPKNGQKINSDRSLYEVYAVRFYQSEKRTLGGATRIMPLPEMTPPRTVIEIDEQQQQQQQMDQSTVLRGNPFKPLASTARSSVDSSILAELNESVGNATLGENADDDVGTDGMLPGGNKSHPEFKDTKIPDVLVVHFFLPYEPPNMFKQKDDGRGGECVYYLRPSQRFLDEVSGKIPPTSATKLFIKWCNECESDFKMRSRFKCMALVRDIEKHNMGLLKSYNGKPVLITESGRVNSGYHGDIRYLEMTANVHYWAFMAKKGFVSLIPKFKSMQMEVGFTIEAHADSEMPECMLGSTTLSYISESTGPLITEEMQQPVHEHQS